MNIRVLISSIVLLCAGITVGAGGRQAGVLKGRIEDVKGKPIVGAEVRVRGSRFQAMKETTTDQSGAYSFELGPDDYIVSFDAEGFQGGNLTAMQQVEEGKETVVKTIRLDKAKRTSLVRGAVFDADGASLSGVRVKLKRIPTAEEEKDHKRVDSLTRDYVTNSRGEFAFRLPPVRARYQLTATLSGYKSETKIVDVSESEAVPVAFSLEAVKKP